jgi:hypothetical protein
MDFSATLQACLSGDKPTREAGERSLSQWLAQYPEDTVKLLVSSMTLPDDDLSGIAAVLFRRHVLETKLYHKITQETQSLVWTSVLQLPSTQRSLLYLKRVGDVLVNLANAGHNVADLLNYMAVWAASSEEAARELAMYMFELSSDFEHIKGVLRTNCESVLGLLTKALQDPAPAVSLGAIKSLAAFLSGFDEEKQVLPYSPSLTQSLSIFSSVLSMPTPPFDAVIKALNSLAELTELFPRVWKSSIEGLVNLMCVISCKTDFDNEIRAAAAEVLSTLITRAPGMLKKLPKVVVEVLNTALLMTEEVENKDDLAEWSIEEEDTEVVQNDPYSLGKDLLNRASVSLGSEAVMPVMLQVIPVLLNGSAEWTKQHTGILAIGVIAEGCHKHFEANLAELLSFVLPYTQSQNPRLRWAALTTLGLLLTEFEPTIQLNFHSEVMPRLLTCMTECANYLQTPSASEELAVYSRAMLRVSTQAAACLINYSRGLNDEVDVTAPLTQYANALFGALANLLNIGMTQNSYPLLEEVLNSLSVTASALSESFAPFYNEFMPGLKTLVGSPATTDLQKQVQANCIRAIGFLVQSVSETSQYVEDANAVFNGLLGLKPTLPSDSPSYIAIYEVMGHFAACLKTHFLPYLDLILPELLQNASLEVKITFHDADSAEAMELGPNMNAICFEFKGMGDKQLAINTLELEMKIKAVRILFDIVSELGKAFAPYVEPTVRTLTPLFDYVYSSDIRKYAYKTISACSACCEQAQGEAFLRGIFPIFANALANASKNLPPSDSKRLLTSLLGCLEEVEGVAVVGLAAASEISAVLAAVVRKAFERKVSRTNAMKELVDTDLYSDELEQCKENDKVDDMILTKVMEVVGKLLKGFKVQFQPIFCDNFKTLYAELLFKPNPTDSETLAAICLFDDYVEFTGDLFFAEGRSPVIDQLLKFANNANPDIRQSATYGIGVCAEKASRDAFAPYLQAAYEAVNAVVNAPDAKNEVNGVATDCVVGAIGKLAVFQLNSLLGEWVKHLPIKAEPEEAQAVHKNFLRNVAVNSPKDPAVSKVLDDLVGLVNTQPSMVDADDMVVLFEAHRVSKLA